MPEPWHRYGEIGRDPAGLGSGIGLLPKRTLPWLIFSSKGPPPPEAAGTPMRLFETPAQGSTPLDRISRLTP